MTPQELKTIEINTRVFHKKEELILTILNVIGFTNKGKIFIPCFDDKNNIDDYCIDDLILFSGEKTETENIYLNRLKEQYYEVKRCVFPSESNYVRARYGGMREFCLHTQLISFNDIELMEYEVNRESNNQAIQDSIDLDSWSK